MKIYKLILVALIINCYSSAQQKMSINKINVITGTKLAHNPDLSFTCSDPHLIKYYESKQKAFNTLKMQNKASSKSMSWQWDTLNEFDTTNAQIARHIQSLDNNGNVLVRLIEQWTGTNWLNYSRYTYTYDSCGNKVTELWEKWLNNAWVNYTKDTCTYDTSGNILSELKENWFAFGQTWRHDHRNTYTYDNHYNLITDLRENWQTTTWENYDRHTYSYDSNDNMISDLLESWQTTTWVNDERITYSYDLNGNLLTGYDEDWQSNTWVNYLREMYTYDVNNYLVTVLYDNWHNNAWNNVNRFSYTYDLNGNNISELIESWYNSYWENCFMYSYTYDNNGNSITGMIESWSSSSWNPTQVSDLYVYSNKAIIYSIHNIYRYTAHYTSFTTGVNDPKTYYGNIVIYPNPASSIISVKDYPGNSVLKICNLNGQVMKEEKLRDKETLINISNLVKGVYILEIRSEIDIWHNKLIKE